MATWIEFLTEVRNKTEASKQDSGWITNPVADLQALLNRVKGLMNPISNLPKLFTGDPPKDKN